MDTPLSLPRSRMSFESLDFASLDSESEDAQEGEGVNCATKKVQNKTLTQILLYWFGLTLDLRPVLNPLIEFH